MHRSTRPGDPEGIVIRGAGLADIALIAHHRVAMFTDMGSVSSAATGELTAATRAFLQEAIPRGEYRGWLAGLACDPERVLAGAGVQLRRTLPFPRRQLDGRESVAEGRQAIVLNVYTEPAFRRRGLARALMDCVLDWARTEGIESLVLHAAPDGRSLYEALGFVPTNEMRFMGEPAGAT